MPKAVPIVLSLSVCVGACARACELGRIICAWVSVSYPSGIMRLQEVNVAHEFRRGDALVFPSHKYHCVQPVGAGMRQVMILEFWVGEERDCNHRFRISVRSSEFLMMRNVEVAPDSAFSIEITKVMLKMEGASGTSGNASFRGWRSLQRHR